MFKYLKAPRDLTDYNLMLGTTDFGNEVQFNMYEKGYAALFVIKIPKFLEKLAETDSSYSKLINNYKHILEREFKSLSGFSDISTDTLTINDGSVDLQVIGKVDNPGSREFTMSYYERSGSLLTKAHELYLTGIKDPDTQVKHYHGLIDDYIYGNASNGGSRLSGSDPGPHRECFTFMYFLTDNTMTKIERAFLIAAAQPNIADFGNLYTGQKGQIEFAELQLSFNGFFITNDICTISDIFIQSFIDIIIFIHF